MVELNQRQTLTHTEQVHVIFTYFQIFILVQKFIPQSLQLHTKRQSSLHTSPNKIQMPTLTSRKYINMLASLSLTHVQFMAYLNYSNLLKTHRASYTHIIFHLFSWFFFLVYCITHGGTLFLTSFHSRASYLASILKIILISRPSELQP